MVSLMMKPVMVVVTLNGGSESRADGGVFQRWTARLVVKAVESMVVEMEANGGAFAFSDYTLPFSVRVRRFQESDEGGEKERQSKEEEAAPTVTTGTTSVGRVLYLHSIFIVNWDKNYFTIETIVELKQEGEK